MRQPQTSAKGYANLIKSKALSTALSKVPDEMWTIDCLILEAEARPTNLDRRLKKNLWIALAQAETDKPVKFRSVYSELCSYTHFYNNILSRPWKLAWLFAGNFDDTLLTEALKAIALNKLENIISLPLTKVNGKTDTDNIQSIVQAIAILFDVKIHKRESSNI